MYVYIRTDDDFSKTLCGSNLEESEINAEYSVAIFSQEKRHFSGNFQLKFVYRLNLECKLNFQFFKISINFVTNLQKNIQKI